MVLGKGGGDPSASLLCFAPAAKASEARAGA
jgi:hypothetical protein